ncbi:MAG: DUF2232 domain-containing protein [Alphaproteobacteria bacterium]|nr:DUF2232 domain-containing protein [Alphaproteobacteria bacterium]
MFLAGIPIFYSYFAYGQQNGWISTFLATVIISLFFPKVLIADIFLNIFILSAVVAHISLKNIVSNKKVWWYPENFLLRDFIILSSIVLLLMAFSFRTEDSVTKLYEDAVKLIFNNNNNDILYQTLVTSTVKSLMKYFLGMTVFFNMITTLFNMQIAYRLVKKYSKTNIRPAFDGYNLSISNWLAVYPLVVFTLSKIFSAYSYIFCGLFVIGLFALMLAGFSFLNFVAKKKRVRNTTKIMLILLLFVFPLQISYLAAFIGIIDSFYPLREKLFYKN